MKRHNDQGNLQKEAFNRVLNSFRELACGHRGRECGGRHAVRAVHSDLQAPGKGERKTEPGVGLNLTAHLQ